MSTSNLPTAAEAKRLAEEKQAKDNLALLEKDLVRVTRMITEATEAGKTSVAIPGLWCLDEVEKHLKEKGYRLTRYTTFVDDEPSPYPGLAVHWN